LIPGQGPSRADL